MLKDLTLNEYSLQEAFDSAKEIRQQTSVCFTAYLGIRSLFVNIPLEEVINICLNESFGKK